jgi:hypothetical protein
VTPCLSVWDSLRPSSAVVVFFLSVDSSWRTLLFGNLFLMWGLVLGASTLKSESSHGPAKEISVSQSRFQDLFTPPDDAEM